MEKRFIKVSAPIPVVTIDGKNGVDQNGNPVIVPFEDFVVGRLGDPVFGVSASNLCAQQSIRLAVLNCKEGDTVKLDEDDWKLLLVATETPNASRPYDPAFAGCLLPHRRAIKEASNTAQENS